MNFKFTILFIFAAVVVADVQGQIAITVDNGATAGTWAPTWSTCPEGTKAVAYDTANQYPGFERLDETALNSIRLYCDSGDSPDTWTTITSNTAEYIRITIKNIYIYMLILNYIFAFSFVEAYDLRYDCPKGTFLVGFRLRVQPIVDDPADFDNTAANNIHFRCSVCISRMFDILLFKCGCINYFLHYRI